MVLKFRDGENQLFETRPEKKIFNMWIITKVFPLSILTLVIINYVKLVLWVFFFALPSGRSNMSFPIHLFEDCLPLFLCCFVLYFVYYRNLMKTFVYYITNQRCVFSGGIFVRRIRSVPFHKITDVEINQNFIEAIFGIYSLKVFTPGTGSTGARGFEKAEIVFSGLQNAEAPADIIQDMLKKYKATGE